MTEKDHKANLLKQLLLAENADELSQDLRKYVEGAWPTIEPGTPFLSNWHIDLICEYLTAVSKSQIRRLIINIPPRYMKSTLVAVAWPTWEWTRDPSSRWIFAAYSDDLSTQHSVARRHLVDSDWYQARWGHKFNWLTDQNVKTEYENTCRGRMFSTGVGGTLTGKGGNFIVVDDPLNPKKAASDIERENANTWFGQTLSTRLDNKKRGRIVLIMQRLHEADMTGYLLAKGGWEHLLIPGIAPEPKQYSFPESGRVKEVAEGEALWPEREGPEEIENAKRDLGSYGFSGQYMQRPAPADGAVFKRSWFKFYRELPAELEVKIQSWDCAFKDTDGTDFISGQVWAKKGANKYLLYRVHERMGFQDTVRAIRAVNAFHPDATAKLVEDKANGSAVIDTLKDEIAGILPVEPRGGKLARAYAVQPTCEAGNVWLPDPSIAPWIEAFLHELTMFPKGVHDDDVDSFTQAITWLDLHGGGIHSWLKMEKEKQLEREQADRRIAAIEEAKRTGKIVTWQDAYDNKKPLAQG